MPTYARNDLKALSRSGSPGYTLLELLVVLAIISIVVGLSLSAFSSASADRLHLRSEASRLATELRDGHIAALRDNRTVSVQFDRDGRSWRFDEKVGHSLPDGMNLTITATQSMSGGATSATIQFFPHGGSTGGRIQMNSRGEGAVITIDWLTSDIKLTFI